MKRYLALLAIGKLQVKITEIALIKQTSINEDVEGREPSKLAGGNVKWLTLCNAVWWLLKRSNRVATWPSNFIPRYIRSRNEKYVLPNNLDMKQTSTLHDNQSTETTQTSIRWGMGDSQVIDLRSLCNGLSFCHGKEGSMDSHCNMDNPWKHYVKWKQPATEGHISCDFIYIKWPE